MTETERKMSEQKYASWNPWHGCTKYSEGCRYCYVYRQDEAYGSSVSSEQCRKTQNFHLPIKKKRDGAPKIEPGSIVMTCFTSDFLLKDKGTSLIHGEGSGTSLQYFGLENPMDGGAW